MAIITRGKTLWLDVKINGVRYRESLKTDDPKLAQELHDQTGQGLVAALMALKGLESASAEARKLLPTPHGPITKMFS